MFVDFFKAFESINRGKMEETLISYSLREKTVTAIMKLCKNAKAVVGLLDKDADFFEIVAGGLQRDT